MGIRRQYIVNVDVEDESDIEPMEEMLQEILLDLYDAANIEKIHVVDNNSDTSEDDDLKELTEVLDQIEAREIIRSIELVREMEEGDDDE